MTRTEKLEQLREDFGGECVECGEDRSWLLEFHHVTPRYISGRPPWRAVREWSYERILAEYTSECELLCRNCHGHAHYLITKENKD